MSQPALFLDRDGIINNSIVREGKPYPPQTLEQFAFVEGIEALLQAAKRAGYLLVIFTNQPDVSRGTQTLDQVEEFHHFIREHLPIDQVYACFHDSADRCSCRKPEPGMLHQAQKEWDIDLSRSFALGDRWRDIDAGNKAGCQTIFLDYGYEEALRSQPHFIVHALPEVHPIIL